MTGETPAKQGQKPPSPPSGKKSAAEEREARLKAALKANMARRKAQAKVRGARATGQDQTEG